MIRMEFKGEDEVIKKLAAISSNETRADILNDFGTLMLSVTQGRFETETAPDGQPWQQSYRAREDGGQTLTDSGVLRNEVSYNHSAERLEVGSATEYAAIHQYGGDIVPKNGKALVFKVGGHVIVTKKVTMPARPFLGFSENDEKELESIVHEHWQEALQ
jgi:phage virion morphogenesis protein